MNAQSLALVVYIEAELCDAVVEGDTVADDLDALGVGVVTAVAAVGDTPLGVDAGAEGTDALGVVVAAVGDTPLGVDAGAEGVDALGVVAPAVGDTVIDVTAGATEGARVTAELGVPSENVTFRTLFPAQM